MTPPHKKAEKGVCLKKNTPTFIDNCVDCTGKCTETTDNANFMQVGRVVQCGHCHPEKYAKGLEQAEKHGIQCTCVCHDALTSFEEETIKKFNEKFYSIPDKTCLWHRNQDLREFILSSLRSLTAMYRKEIGNSLKHYKMDVEEPGEEMPTDILLASDQAFNKGLEVAQQVVNNILKL